MSNQTFDLSWGCDNRVVGGDGRLVICVWWWCVGGGLVAVGGGWWMVDGGGWWWMEDGGGWSKKRFSDFAQTSHTESTAKVIFFHIWDLA